MVCHFWHTCNLPHNTMARVMKIIPKKADNYRLKDWRVLTMLPIVYKLKAKLLSVKVSPHYYHILGPQQIGFIPGRFMLENISLAWMTQLGYQTREANTISKA